MLSNHGKEKLIRDNMITLEVMMSMADIGSWVQTNLLFILIVFVIVLVIGYIAFSFRQLTKIKHLMENQATKRNGTVHGFFFLSFLKFFYRDQEVMVSSRPGQKNRPPRTSATIPIQVVKNLWISIHRETITSSMGKLVGSQDIQLDVEEFDKTYLIKGDDELTVRTLVNLPLQMKLLEMKQMKPYVLIDNFYVNVHVPKIIQSDYEYDQLIDVALLFFDRLRELGWLKQIESSTSEGE
jgi:hypothetical protein